MHAMLITQFVTMCAIGTEMLYFVKLLKIFQNKTIKFTNFDEVHLYWELGWLDIITG
jgi:hypothetical protein